MLRTLWRNLLRRADVEEDLSEELRAHLDLLVDQKVKAGLPHAEARRSALLEMGGVEQVKESVRDVRAGQHLATFFQDLRYGARGLARSPGFTATLVLTLSLGIAANTAIFSLVNALLFRSLPVREPERLVLLVNEDGASGRGPHPPGRLKVVSCPLYQRLRAETAELFEALAAEQSGDLPSLVHRAGDEPALADAAGRLVTANYFTALGLPAWRGRLFAPDDDAPTAAPVIVLSHHYWQRRFAADPALLGTRLTVNGTSYTVVGVTPPGFVGSNVGRPSDFWVPLAMQPRFTRSESRLEAANNWWLLALGRLRAGVAPATAEAKANVILRQFLTPGLVEPNAAPPRLILQPGGQGTGTFRENARQPSRALMAGVALLLLIVWVNASHLLLARAGERRRELSIRAALGATRARLRRQLLTEGLLVAALSVGVSVLAVPWMTGGLLALAEIRVLDVSADGRVLLFTALLALATTLLAGLVPAALAERWRSNLQQALQSASRAFTGRQRLGRILLGSEVALSLVLLVAAGLLAGSLVRLRGADKGFEDERLLLVEIDPRTAGLERERQHVSPPGALELYGELVRRVTALPGVTGASVSVHGLLSGSSFNHTFTVVGSTHQVPGAAINGVSPGYFDAVGMRLLRGRGFTARDHERAPRVAVLNETLARQLFPGGDSLGRRLRDVDEGEIEVVGVVRDAKTAGLTQPVRPMLFAPIEQQDWFARSLEVRTAGEPGALAEAVRRAVRQASPQLAILSIRTVASQIDRTLAGERFMVLLAGAFGLSALFLLAVGLYGVIARWVAQRTIEIGLRMALGATAGAVRAMVLRQVLGLVMVGLAVGVPVALGAGRLLQGMVVGLRPLEPVTLAGAALAVLVVAGLAAWLPARRACRVDPMVALRAE